MGRALADTHTPWKVFCEFLEGLPDRACCPLSSPLPAHTPKPQCLQVKALVDGVVREHGQVDHAVSCFGAWWQGGLLTEQSYAEFSKVRCVGRGLMTRGLM